MARKKNAITRRIDDDIIFLSEIENWFNLTSEDIINYMIDCKCYMLVNDYRNDLDFYSLSEVEPRFEEIIATKKMLINRRRCL